jgi:hypothetical protein
MTSKATTRHLDPDGVARDHGSTDVAPGEGPA